MKKQLMKDLFRESILFLIGGFIYVMIEIIGRGFSHWSMFIVGGLCFIIIGLLNEYYTWDIEFPLQMLYGCIVITLLEFISGYIVNIQLHWNVWDYHDRFMNLYGQICLYNSCLWYLLSAVAIVLDDVIRWKCFHEQKPKYKFFGKIIP